MIRSLVKKAFQAAGYRISKRDPLEEAIPGDFNHSPFLPRVYRGALDRYLYFLDQLSSVRGVQGDIVECGVSIGYGTLLFLLLSEYIGVPRTYYGFDSFEGFPDPVEEDGHTSITGKDYWATPPEVVMKVLRDGRIPEEMIASRVRLVKGFFSETLPRHDGKIALLHLDCDLYESYKTALNALYDKVQPGGLIMFDEYRDSRWPGATKAIDEFFSDRPETVQAHPRCTWKYFVVKA